MKPHITLVVLAGGLGSRFGGAKQIARLPHINRTIMELSIEDAYQAGVRHVVLVVNALVRESVTQQILPNLPHDLEVDVVEQRIDDVPDAFQARAQKRNKPWGTGHALLCAKPHIRDKAIVITADDYYGDVAYKQMVNHFAHSDNWACVAYPLKRTLSEQGGVNRGICQLNRDSQLLKVEEVLNISEKDGALVGEDQYLQSITLADTALASMTFWGVDLRLFTVLAQNFSNFLSNHDNGVKKEYYLPDQIQYCIDTQDLIVDVYTAQQPWLGMTYKDELAVLAEQIVSLRGITGG
ncbi:nucleotidyltransferase family protein [Pseudoalteromonas sp. SSDWG2]|uniref:nucleotidyltransferase family protein n=1 Tax=Pseudoalteromonas sp. SSDWG2 TaxID=3139391 RepID=UPI003BAAC446